MTGIKMDSGIIAAIGDTRLARLNRIQKDDRIRLYAKLEGLNPGGSIKDRAALSILRRALETGDVREDTVIIESSSGNMGIGLAQLCAVMGLRFICVVDAKTTPQNLAILQAYGAEIDLIREPHPISDEFLEVRLDRVKELLRIIPNSFWPNQYSNLYNAIAHHQTMHEIATELNGKVDYLFCATSTCGTIRGCAEYARAKRLPTRVFAVDAVGSAIFGDKKARRLIPGHGASIVPELCQLETIDRCIHVSDLECVVGCRVLVRQEGILAGGSSGGVLMAFQRIKSEIPDDSNCVLIFPDRGERYLETVYSDSWVAKHFGEVSHLWDEFDASKCLETTS